MMMQQKKRQSLPPQNDRKINNQASSLTKRSDGGDDFNSRNIQIFNQFDNLSRGIFSGMASQFGMMMPQAFRGFDDIEDQIMGFSDLHNKMLNMPQKISSGGGGFQMISQSFAQSSKMGPNGQMITEKYFDNNQIGKGRDGKTISERQQGYKNSGTGIDKFAHERMLEAQGKKYIKERNQNGQVSTTHHYFNLDENQSQLFDNNWQVYRSQIGLGNLQNQSLAYQANQMGSLGQGINQNNSQKQRPNNHQNAFENDHGYGIRNSRDIQPTQLGRRSTLQANPTQSFTNNDRVRVDNGRVMVENPRIEQNRGNQQPVQNMTPIIRHRPQPQRNEDHTGVYKNKAVSRNQYPQAG